MVYHFPALRRQTVSHHNPQRAEPFFASRPSQSA
jgi:hypothetical protein